MKIICVGDTVWNITIPISKFPLKNIYNNVVEVLSIKYLDVQNLDTIRKELYETR